MRKKVIVSLSTVNMDLELQDGIFALYTVKLDRELQEGIFYLSTVGWIESFMLKFLP